MIKSQQKTALACRFCFMCRHLAPVGNVTFREADTPRGRALAFDHASANPDLWLDADYADTFFQADLSGACRQHCVSHYDEVGLILAARHHLARLGRAPAAVKELVRELATETSVATGPAGGQVAYFVDPSTAKHQPEVAAAMELVVRSAGLTWVTVTGSDSGKAPHVLGFPEEARRLATAIAGAVADSGAKVLVTSCPASYDAFLRDYPQLGVPLPEGVEVLHSSDFIARLIAEKRLEGSRRSPAHVYPLASDYLRNYQGSQEPVDVLSALGVERTPFGTNQEESYTAGEGAVVADRLYPALVGKLARYVAERRRDPEDTLLTFSPYTKYALTTFSLAPVKVTTLEELTADWLRGGAAVPPALVAADAPEAARSHS